ncbi:MAG: hypothetical protein AB8H79_18030 [Myxococcota bacterium]
MRLVPILIAGLLLSTSAWAGDTVKVTRSPLKVGEKATITESLAMTIDMKITMGENGTMDGKMVAQRDVVRDLEVTEVTQGITTGARVTYTQATNMETMFGQEQSTTLPVQGKTYLMTFDTEGKPLTVALDGDGEVTDAAREFLLEDGFLDSAGLSGGDVGTESLTIGDDIKEFSSLASSMPKMDPTSATFSAKVAGVRKAEQGKVVVVELIMKGNFDENNMMFTIDGTGEMLLHQKRGYIHDMALKAPITLSGGETTPDGVKMHIEGKGDMTVTVSTRLK